MGGRRREVLPTLGIVALGGLVMVPIMDESPISWGAVVQVDFQQARAHQAGGIRGLDGTFHCLPRYGIRHQRQGAEHEPCHGPVHILL